MTSKQAIVAELGSEELLAPEMIARSLEANDRVKYYFALLQTARANADRPQVPAPDLKTERLASGLTDSWLDDIIVDAEIEDGDCYRIPRVGDVLQRIVEAVGTMLDCLPEPRQSTLRTRLDRLAPPIADDDTIRGKLLDAMTSGDRRAGDSLHLLVMDAHRAINRLQAEIAVDSLDGAAVYGLSEAGRRRVAAFMAGLNRTAPLKFNHPGLGTTATEHGGQILIQNDIGTTDAHVLVVRVRGLTASLAYSDIHRARLDFFKSLFAPFGVAWEGTAQHESGKIQTGSYLLVTGTYEAADEAALDRYLDYLGSRIVFLIDWNRMRKRLRAFVGKSQALAVLKWAADNDFGHRGLLEIGGEQALAEAIEYAAGKRLRYGDRLDALLDDADVRAFLRFALEVASVGLQERRSRRNILDEIKAKLRGCFEDARLQIFDIAAAHAACAYDLAVTLREALDYASAGSAPEMLARFAARAVEWEATADGLLNDAREDIKRFERPPTLLGFFELADDAVDDLEEAVDLVDLCGSMALPDGGLDHLRALSDLALDGVQYLVKCVECAASVTRADVRDDLDGFLTALEGLVAIEHRADSEFRALRRWLIRECDDQRRVMLIRELAQAMESATDACALAGHRLRSYLMDTVIQ